MNYIEKAIEEAGYHPSMGKNPEHLFLLPAFWQALGKAREWGQQIYERRGNKDICTHCGIDCTIQPSRESGCNHVHYPEACDTCSKKEKNWRRYAADFFDHLMRGKDAEEFFAAL